MIGPQVKSLRMKQRLDQKMLAARCSTQGWDITQNTITKIETQVRCVKDAEVLVLASALRVKLKEFFPQHPKLF